MRGRKEYQNNGQGQASGRLTATVAFAFILFAHSAAAEAAYERRIEEEKRSELEYTEKAILAREGRLVFDSGGWINVRYDNYHDYDNDSSIPDVVDFSLSMDYRFWMKATLRPPAGASYENEHSLYIRIKDSYIYRYPVNIAGGKDHDPSHIDYAYLSLDLRPVWVEAGRRYFTVGRGIAYSNVNDGAQISLVLPDGSLSVFGSHTLPREDNIDTSVPGYVKGADRYYVGAECDYLGIPEQDLYGYYVMQIDSSDESPDDPARDYSYDSEYMGVGAKGRLSSLRYWAELIRQTGTSRVFATNEKRDIDAWAGIFGAAYDMDIYSHPTLLFEYAFGSGDKDRVNVTDTLNGNIIGDDENFLYFGYLPTGYALSPVLSNLHFYRAGISAKPFEKWRLFKNCVLSVDHYWYFKDKEAGGIYDTDATVASSRIGSEVDVTLFWQIFSDLSCEVQYGYFNPGDAYPDSADDSESYLGASMSLTF